MFGKKSNYSKFQKEQLKEKKKQEDVVNLKVKEKIWPVLEEISEDTFDAKVILSVLKQVIQQALLNRQMKMSLSELSLTDLLKNDTNSQWIKYEKLINTLEDEPIGVTYQILEGLVSEIEAREKLYMRHKKLSELLCE